jgi:hypothetical protein
MEPRSPYDRALRIMIAVGIAGALAVGLILRHVFGGADVESRMSNKEDGHEHVLAPPTLWAGPQEPPTGGLAASPAPTRYARLVVRRPTTEEPESLPPAEPVAVRDQEVAAARAHYDEVRAQLAAAGGPESPAATALLPDMEAAAARLRRAEAAYDRREGRVLRARWRR